MNELEDRLTDLLTRTAEAVPVRPDLDEVTGVGAVHPLVDPSRRPRPRRAVALVAAAAVLLVVAGFVLTRGGGDDGGQAVDVASAPPSASVSVPVGETVFPVFGDLPPEVAGSVSRQIHPALDPDFLIAYVGRVGSDGGWDDTITVFVSRQADPAPDVVPFPRDGQQPTTTETVAGREATVWRRDDGGTTLLFEDPRPVMVMGEDPIPVLEAMGPDWLTVPAEGDDLDRSAVEMRPAAGYELLLATDLPAGDPLPRTSIGDPATDEPLVLQRLSRDPLIVMSDIDRPRPVDVNGQPGWTVGDGRHLAWTTEDGTHLLLDAENDGVRDGAVALRIAEGVRLVDEATWQHAEVPVGGG